MPDPNVSRKGSKEVIVTLGEMCTGVNPAGLRFYRSGFGQALAIQNDDIHGVAWHGWGLLVYTF